MNKIIGLILVLSFTTSCVRNRHTNTENSKQLNNTQNSIEKFIIEEITEFIEAPEFSALSGSIYVNGKTHQFHFGELTDGTKPNNQTLYEIGSISKTYVGLLLSQAVHDGKLNLDEDIRKYLNSKKYSHLKLNNSAITLRHLATHTSGLPVNLNCNDLEYPEKLDCIKSYSREVFFDKLLKVKLLDDSGKKYNYSNAGIRLIGYILEEVYNDTFPNLLKRYVFSKSGEQNTIYRLDENLKLEMALGKNSDGEIMPIASEFYASDGALKSNTSSMLNYIKMYMESQDAAVKQSLNLLTEKHNRLGRAYVWNTFEYNTTNQMFYHSGGTFGFSSWIALYPKKNIGIFLVTNVSTSDAQEKLNQISNRIIDKIKKTLHNTVYK
ncbi:serine hydrolase domain-containing protein [Robiginitalea sp. IMCC44478]|uniref:serine hydrolase domain-containing protein n=1 Tax=Robiginitalea sp. IMCC44478 TaxID=3459122 RepID=UPI00404201C6